MSGTCIFAKRALETKTEPIQNSLFKRRVVPAFKNFVLLSRFPLNSLQRSNAIFQECISQDAPTYQFLIWVEPW